MKKIINLLINFPTNYNLSKLKEKKKKYIFLIYIINLLKSDKIMNKDLVIIRCVFLGSPNSGKTALT